jgi:hypothetical protein
MVLPLLLLVVLPLLLLVLPLLLLPQCLACGWANRMHRHSNPRSTLRHTDLQASHLPCNHSIALMLVQASVLPHLVQFPQLVAQTNEPSSTFLRAAVSQPQHHCHTTHRRPAQTPGHAGLGLMSASCTPSDHGVLACYHDNRRLLQELAIGVHRHSHSHNNHTLRVEMAQRLRLGLVTV